VAAARVFRRNERVRRECTVVTPRFGNRRKVPPLAVTMPPFVHLRHRDPAAPGYLPQPAPPGLLRTAAPRLAGKSPVLGGGIRWSFRPVTKGKNSAEPNNRCEPGQAINVIEVFVSVATIAATQHARWQMSGSLRSVAASAPCTGEDVFRDRMSLRSSMGLFGRPGPTPCPIQPMGDFPSEPQAFARQHSWCQLHQDKQARRSQAFLPLMRMWVTPDATSAPSDHVHAARAAPPEERE